MTTTTGFIKRYFLTGMVVLVSALLGTAPVAASSLVPASDGIHVQGYSLPGIISASWPNFENNVFVRVVEQGNHGAMLIATGGRNGYFNLNPDTSYKIQGGGYLLKARFGPTGNLLSGNVKITGTIDTEYGRASGLLMTAKLGDKSGDGIDWNFSSDLIGFDTNHIKCNAVIDSFAACTQHESVFLSLNEGGFNGLEKYSSKGLAVTSVPVPAAAWLFGSGLLGLVGAARQKFS